MGDFDRPHEDAPIADDNVFADYFQGVVMAVRARECLGPRVTGHAARQSDKNQRFLIACVGLTLIPIQSRNYHTHYRPGSNGLEAAAIF